MFDPVQGDDGEVTRPPASMRRWSFILSVWAEPVQETGQASPLAWRGYLEWPSRERNYFDTLAELNRLMSAATGWQDSSSR